MIKVALTGATGFIGRHVLDELNSLDAVVVIATTRELREEDQEISNGRWAHMDISKPPDNVFNALGCPDILIHLAWQGLPNYHSLHHYEVELLNQYSFIKQLVQQGLKSVVVAGTCFEYGMQSGSLSEEIDTRPTNPYGFAKDSLRKQLQYLQSIHPFNLTWARLFYMYGDGQSNASLIPQLKKAVEQGDKVFKMSGGEQLRDYLHINEVANKIVLLALLQKNIGAINICSGKPISIRSLIEKYIHDKQWNIEIDFGFYPYPDYEPLAFWGNPNKINKWIGCLC